MGQYAQQIDSVQHKWDDLIHGVGLSADATERAAREHERAIKAAHGNAEAIRKANEAYQQQLRNIERSTEAIDEANRARAAELELIGQQIKLAVNPFLDASEMDPASGGTRGMSDFAQQAAEIDLQFQDYAAAMQAIVEAGGEATLSQEQLAAAEHNALVDAAQSMIDGWGLPIEQAMKTVTDFGKSMKSLQDMLAKGAITTDEYRRVQKQLIDQYVLGMGNLALSILNTMAAGDEGSEAAQKAAALKQQLDKMTFELQVAQFDILYQALMQMDNVSQGVKDNMTDLFNFINNPDNWPTFGGGGGGGGGGGNGPPNPGSYDGQIVEYGGHSWRWDSISQSWTDLGSSGGGGGGGGGGGEDPIQAAHDLLRRYQDMGLSRWERALRDLNDDFNTIRQTLGNTAEVAQAYADALERLRHEFLQGLQDFYDQLRSGPIGGATIQTQFAAAQARYAQLLAAVQGGDLSQADALAQAGQDLIALAAQMFGTSTGGFEQLRQQILDQIAAILGVTNTTDTHANNVVNFPQAIHDASTAQVTATNNVADVVDIASRRQETLLQHVIDRLDYVVDLLSDIDANDTGNLGFSGVAS